MTGEGEASGGPTTTSRSDVVLFEKFPKGDATYPQGLSRLLPVAARLIESLNDPFPLLLLRGGGAPFIGVTVLFPDSGRQMMERNHFFTADNEGIFENINQFPHVPGP